MTDDSLLTKCPHCKTLFRIQQEHLAAAGGEVRCGVCYKVFDAENKDLPYSQSEDSPAEKTFSVSDSKINEQKNDNSEKIIDTSPKPTAQKAQKAQASANIEQPHQDNIPSTDNIGQADIKHSSINGTTTPQADYNKSALVKWSSCSLLAIVVFFSQWLYFNFDKNAQNPKWRPTYSAICEKLRCKLPLYQKVSSIKTKRLAIKTHPDYANVLIVDIIINNTAEYDQALPLLNMTFSSLNGKLLAQRLFKPKEYLGQQLQQLPKIPTKTPVHLSFAILDPGSEAVNYSVQFAPSS